MEHPPQQRPPQGLSGQDYYSDLFAREAGSSAQASAIAPVGEDEAQEDVPDRGFLGQLGVSTARGVGRAVNETSNSIVGLGKWAARLGDGLDGVEDSGFDWARDPDNPLTFDISEETAGTAWGFYEGMVQFVTSFAPWSRAAKAAGLVDDAFRGAQVVRGMAAGAVADATAFDPQEDRLSNLVQAAPWQIQNPLTEFLAAEEDDSELEGRLKNAMEGLFLGGTIDAALGIFKAARAARLHSKGKITKAEADERVAQHLREVEEAEPGRDSPFSVEDDEGSFVVKMDPDSDIHRELIPRQVAKAAVRVPDGQGGFTIVPFEGEGLGSHLDVINQLGDDVDLSKAQEGFTDQRGEWVTRKEAEVIEGVDEGETATIMAKRDGIDLESDVDPMEATEGVTQASSEGALAEGLPTEFRFSNRAQAETVAASLNAAVRKDPITDAIRLTDDQVNKVKAIGARILGGRSPQDMQNLTEGIDLNFGRIDSPEESRALINSVSEALREEFQSATNRSSEGFGQSWAETAELAEGFIEGVGGEVVARNIMNLVGDTQNLAHEILAARMVFHAQAKRISRIQMAAQLAPTNPIAHHLLARELDTFVNFAVALAGTKSNIGRALGAMNIKVSAEGRALVDETIAEFGGRAGKEGASEADRAAKEVDKALEDVEAKVPEAGKELDSFEKVLRDAQQAVGRGTNTVSAEDFIRMWENRRAKGILSRAAKVLGEDLDAPTQEQLDLGEFANALDIWREGQEVVEVTAEQADAAARAPQGQNPVEELARIIRRDREALDEAGSGRQQAGEAAEEAGEDAVEGAVAGTSPLSELIDTHRDLFRRIEATIKSEQDLLERIKNGEGRPNVEPGNPTRAVTISNPISKFIRDQQLSPRELRALARTLEYTEGDENAMLKALVYTVKASDPKNARDPSFMTKFLGFRASMMLSGVKTHAINLISSSMAAMLRPAEILVGGALTGNKEMTQLGFDQLVSPMMQGRLVLGEAMAAARRVLRKGNNELDPYFAQVDDQLVVQAVNDPNATFLTKILHVPTRLLMSGDEFVKQLSYRSNVRAQALRKAREEALQSGRSWTPDQLAVRVEEDIRGAFSPDGQAVNPRALAMARESTFTSRLDHGLGKKILDIGNEEPWFRLIMPFIRTPVNIFRFGWQRAPVLGRFQRQMREDLAAGGTRRADALGKQALGFVTYGAAALMAKDGLITGAGPEDPRLRSQLLDSGWQPYSIRVGNNFISFRRLEPVATPLAIVADFVESFGELDERTAEEGMIALSASMSSSATSKTFLIGLSEFFAAVSSGREDRVRRFVSSFATSFTPALARQANPDPMWRDARGVIDEMRGAIPGFSQGLPPRRNIFGEPVMKPPGYFNRSFNPFTVITSGEVDEKQMELVELGKSMPMPRDTWADGRIRLRDAKAYPPNDPEREGQTPYDRMLELLSTPLVGGRTLRERVENEMDKESWERLSSGHELYPGGEKHRRISRIVTLYQEAARTRVLQEYDSLRAVVRQDRRNEIDALMGRLDRIEELP